VSDWRSIGISYDGEETTFGDEERRLRERAHDRPEESFEVWLELALSLVEAGIADGAWELLRSLRETIEPQQIPVDRWPWLLNVEGMALKDLGRVEDAERAYRTMLDLSETLMVDERRKDLISTAQQNLGNLCLGEDPHEATELLAAALEVKRELGDMKSVADVQMSMGVARMKLEDWDGAERLFAEVETMAVEHDDLRLLGSVRGNRGTLHVSRGDFTAAEEAYSGALDCFEKMDDSVKEATALESLGLLNAELGNVDAAIEYHERALTIATALGSSTLLLRTRRSLARLLVREGRWDAAEEQLGAAGNLAQDLGDLATEADVIADLGAVLMERGDVDRARGLLNQADDLLSQVGDARRLIDVLWNLGELALRSGDFARAQAMLERAEALLTSQPRDTPPDLLAGLVRRRAEIALGAGADDEAARGFEREFEVLLNGGSAEVAAWQAATAGTLLLGAATPELALASLDRAMGIYGERDSPHLVSRIRSDRARALSALARHVEAESELRAMLAIADELSDRSMRREALTSLGELRARLGDTGAAAQLLSEAVDLAEQLADAGGLADAAGDLVLVLIEGGRADEARGVLEVLNRAAAVTGERYHQAVATSAQAALASADGHYSRAVELYQRAAELTHDEYPRHETESLAGLLDNLVISGEQDEERLRDVAQSLVTLAQRSGNEDVGWDALARIGARAVEDDEQFALSMWNTAIRLALVTATDEKGISAQDLEAFRRARPDELAAWAATSSDAEADEFLFRSALSLMRVLILVEACLGSLERERSDRLWKSLVEMVVMSVGEGEAAGPLRDLLEMAWEVLKT
jgi:tetratricopeptide (TPR) repeat protein